MSKKNAAAIGALETVLGDLYVLAVKTHGYHWNVEGPLFPQHHEFFGKQYDALTDAADEVAERIRALGKKAPGSFAQFLKLANIREESKTLAVAAMLAQLLADFETLGADLEAGIGACEKAGDAGSEDLLTGLLRDANKTAWMLRAQLEK